eukprot:662689-Amphidinium_carterae.1
MKPTVLSTAVAGLYAFIKTYGTCQFVRGLWMEIVWSVPQYTCEQMPQSGDNRRDNSLARAEGNHPHDLSLIHI